MSPEKEKYLTDHYPWFFTIQERYKPNIPKGFKFECGDGWFDILDLLFDRMSYDLKAALRNQDAAQMSYNKLWRAYRDGTLLDLPRLRKLETALFHADRELDNERAKVPEIVSVENRLGLLRVKVKGTPAHQAMADMAYDFSTRTCEECGAKAYFCWAESKQQPKQTLCPEHIKLKLGAAYLSGLAQQMACDEIVNEFFPSINNPYRNY